MSFLTRTENGTRTFEIMRRIDTERHIIDEHDVDTHTGFKRAELFELLRPLERRLRQLDPTAHRLTKLEYPPQRRIEIHLAVTDGMFDQRLD